ncbi:MAG: hypothetical protein J6V33_03310 [Bacteroidales bacterium]|nr:hypothetical protein [Bacteroidales bacterium]
MDAIFKNGNVYVVVRDKDIRDDVNLKNLEDLIWNKDLKNKCLYGGRVHLSNTYYSFGNYRHSYSDYCLIQVDGISIERYYLEDNSIVADNKTSIERVAAYLNQIENLGVDTFLENYKLQLQELKKELENKIDNMQQDLAANYDEEKASNLAELKKSVLNITCTIFLLLISMNAGLENQNYIDAYNNIINLYF